MPEKTYSLFATSAKGIEDLLATELRALKLDDVKPGRGGVTFSGNIQQALFACLWSRIANRILLPLKHFECKTEDQLYDEMVEFNWMDVFSESNSIAIDCNISKSNITHNKYAALKTKDAIVDYFRSHTGTRPDIQTIQPDIQLNLYIHNNQATIYLDLSGESLHRRGYRIEGEHAPLKENLAAAILMRSQWQNYCHQVDEFVDPMCGSGTLVIEAAMMAANIASGINRNYWGFEKWKGFQPQIWSSLIDDAKQKAAEGLTQLPLMSGYDASHFAVNAATKNAESAGLDQHIHFEKRDISLATPRKKGSKGFITANPPYGQRISNKAEVAELYHRLGESFKQNFQGWRASVITDSMLLGKKIPLRAGKIHSLYNGAIECKLLHFDINPDRYFDSNRKFRPISSEKRSEGAKMFENRLNKNIKQLDRWAKRENIHCYRVYDADLPDYAIAVDLYYADKCFIVVQEYEAPKTIEAQTAELRLNEALSVIIERFEIPHEQLFIKQRKQQKGAQQYEKLDDNVKFEIVEENDCKFYVNFSNYLDTGLFLDHRSTRKMVQEMAADKDFLNLFAYTASVSVYAAKGGAKSTTSVDMSNTYLNWAQKNFELNEVFGNNHEIVRADCMEWLKAQHKKYDLIFLDPPSFSNSKKMSQHFSIQDDYVALIKQTLHLLNKGGALIFSNNFRNFKLNENAFSQVEIENISRKTIPLDFKRNQKIHHCWIFRKT